MAQIRLPDMIRTPGDTKKYVLQRRLLHLDVGDPDALFAETKDERRDLGRRGVDRHHVRLRICVVLPAVFEERLDGPPLPVDSNFAVACVEALAEPTGR